MFFGGNMEKYYSETIWNNKKGLEVIRLFKRGEIKHFAVFYDKQQAEKLLAMLNEGSFE